MSAVRGCELVVLDSREPEELETYVRNLGVTCSRSVTLPFGDALFTGNGPDGECTVGFERKKLSDLITSMKDRRLSGHQLRGLWSSCDFVYLVAEGLWREGDGGQIEEWRGKGFVPVYERTDGRHAMSYEQLDHYLCTLELKGSVVVHRTKDAKATARLYVSRWKWFNGKRWEDHKSHDQIYTGLPAKGHGAGWGRRHGHDEEYARTQMVQSNPTTCWLAASVLPGIDRKAEVVARHFGTVRRMANATAAEWMGIDFGLNREGTKRNSGIGPVTAKAVVRAITEEGA